MSRGWVYILASGKNGTLYVGVTNDLARRVHEHKLGVGSAFTRKYGVHRLVWFEEHDHIMHAIQREKSITRYPRRWKINLITAMNPTWRDLYEDLNK